MTNQPKIPLLSPTIRFYEDQKKKLVSPSHILGIVSPFKNEDEADQGVKSNQDQNTSPVKNENFHLKLQKKLSSLMPKTSRSKNRYTGILTENSALEQSKVQETINYLASKRNNVVTALGRFKEKERNKSIVLDKMILLNKATEKMNECQEKNLINYDVAQELENDEADITQKNKKNNPLYKTLFPEWGRFSTKYLTQDRIQADDRKISKMMKKHESNGQKHKKNSYPMCMTYYSKLNLCVFALFSDIVLY